MMITFSFDRVKVIKKWGKTTGQEIIPHDAGELRLISYFCEEFQLMN